MSRGSSTRPRGCGSALPGASVWHVFGRGPRRLRLPLPLRASSSHPLSLLSPSVSCHRFPLRSLLLAFPSRFPLFHPLVLLLFQLSLGGLSFPSLPQPAGRECVASPQTPVVSKTHPLSPSSDSPSSVYNPSVGIVVRLCVNSAGCLYKTVFYVPNV